MSLEMTWTATDDQTSHGHYHHPSPSPAAAAAAVAPPCYQLYTKQNFIKSPKSFKSFSLSMQKLTLNHDF